MTADQFITMCKKSGFIDSKPINIDSVNTASLALVKFSVGKVSN